MKKSINKKMIIFIVIGILTLGFIIFIICIKSIYTFKPSFYAYSSYVDNKTKKMISKNYSYKEYGNVSEFEYAFENNKAVAGITSDYSIISLINEGKLAPIRQDIMKINNLINNWEDYFSDSVKEQMNFYNSTLDQTFLKNKFGDNDINNGDYKFSDFIVPYFINDKLIAFDTQKVLNKKNLTLDQVNKELSLNNNSTPTIIEALKSLNQHTTNKSFKVQWSKNERENVVLGATYENENINENWSTKITNDNYEQLLNNFSKIVKEGTGSSINDVKKNLFDTDSDIILNNLINPDSKITTAIIYNGDALDAYYGHDNFSSVEDGDRVRILRTKYTVRILDAFVVSSSIDKNKRLELLTNFNTSLFANMFKSKEELEKIDPNKIYQSDGIMRIFDAINYTPAAKGAYEYIYENYFEDENGNQDEIARDIFQVAKTDLTIKIFVSPISYIEKEVLSKLTMAFQKKLNGY